jgi:hypothetical protein
MSKIRTSINWGLKLNLLHVHICSPSIDAHENEGNRNGEKQWGFYRSRMSPPPSAQRPCHPPPRARPPFLSPRAGQDTVT